MTREHVARGWFAATSLAATVGLVAQLWATAGETEGFFTSFAGRMFNVFCFFTIQSNLLVAVTTALLAISLHRTSTVFAAFRLTAVVAITITAIVFHLALRDLRELQGTAAFADFMLHTASPVLCVVGWLVWGPRGLVSPRVVGWALAFPLGWLAFTLVRGPIVGGFYPYPFLDVGDLGYARVLVNVVVVAALFAAVCAAAGWLDRRLGARERRRPPVVDEGPSDVRGTPRGT